MTFKKKQNCSDRKQIRDCQGLRWGKDTEYQRLKETLWSDGNVLFNCCDDGGYMTRYICH